MSFLDKIKTGASKAADKAQQALEINRINSQISSIRKEIEKTFQQMGQSVYNAYTKNDLSVAEGDIVSLSQQVAKHELTIAELELKLRELKNEKDCPSCRTVVPYESKFCPGCGHQFTASTPVAQPVVEENLPKCTSCQSIIEPGSKFCTSCGHPVQAPEGSNAE